LEPDPDPYPGLMDPDPDPGGPKTCGSGSGFGSPTLLPCQHCLFYMYLYRKPRTVITYRTNLEWRNPVGLDEYGIFLNVWIRVFLSALNPACGFVERKPAT
jgi:hypothetical protein